MKIRYKISLVFLAVAFISLSLLGLFSYRVVKHQLIEARGEQLTAIMLNQKETINHLHTAWKDRSHLIGSRRQLLASFASYLQLPTEEHLKSMESILKDVLQSVWLLEGVVLCDLNGNKIIAVEKGNIKTSLCSPYLPHYIKSYTFDDIWMQESERGQPGNLLVSIAGPLEYNRRPIGVIYTVINAAELIDIVDNYTVLGSTGETVLARYDEQGDVQFVMPLRFDANTGLKRRESADAMRLPTVHALQKKRALLHFSYALDYSGLPVLAATDYIPELDWSIVVKINREEVLQPIHRLRNAIVVYIAAIMLLTFIIGLFLSHVIAQPIARLAQVAQRIRDGDFSLRAQISARDETSHLATTFNEMLNALQELERKVKEKTVLAENRAAKVRELASSLTQAEQTERRRFAELLHDQLQQLLVAAKIGVNRLSQKVTDPLAQTNISQIGGLIEESIDTCRTLTVELSPPILRDAGLARALDWLARWMKEKHGLEISIHVEPGLQQTSRNRKIILFQAVRELFFNIAKHAATLQATVRISQEGNELCIVVEDQGKGFDPKVLNHSSSTHFGLLNVRERLELLGCRMVIESETGKGTRCTLYSPVEEVQPPKDSVCKYSGAPAEASGSPASTTSLNIRTLVADDHKILRQCLICALRECPEVEIIGEAANGQEAVEKAMALEPDVVIMDISMPGMTGIEATRKIKEVKPEIKIIGLSLYEAEEMALAMLEVGASAYHCKSGDFDDLIRSIRRSQEQPPEAPRNDDREAELNSP